MKVLKELLPGCFLLEPTKFDDQRGCFVKTYNKVLCTELGINFEVQEEFYSISHKGVIRGMHFQLPPHEHDKLVYCTQGTVNDVLLDLRKGEGYGRVASTQLSGENGFLIFIPKGIAHGFVALADQSLMVYKTSTMHVPESDCGIHWDSFGFVWDVSQPVLSVRDEQHLAFSNFDSPF